MNDLPECDVAIIFCLLLRDYPVQPTDISKAEPVLCPECSQMMWLSEKKKAMKEEYERQKLRILLCCVDCLIRKGKDGDFSSVNEVIQVNI